MYRKIEVNIHTDYKFRTLSLEAKFAFFNLLTRSDLVLGAFKNSITGLACEQSSTNYLVSPEYTENQFTKITDTVFYTLCDTVSDTVSNTVWNTLSDTIPNRVLNTLYQNLPIGIYKVYFLAILELIEKGFLLHDFYAGLFYLHNWIKYNLPDNSKVVISWNKLLEKAPLPECNLTNYIYARTAKILLDNQRDNSYNALNPIIKNCYEKGYANTLPSGILKVKRIEAKRTQLDTVCDTVPNTVSDTVRDTNPDNSNSNSNSNSNKLCITKSNLENLSKANSTNETNITVSNTYEKEKKENYTKEKKQKAPITLVNRMMADNSETLETSESSAQPIQPTLDLSQPVESSPPKKRGRKKADGETPCPFQYGDKVPDDWRVIAEKYQLDAQYIFDCLVSWALSKNEKSKSWRNRYATFVLREYKDQKAKGNILPDCSPSTPQHAPIWKTALDFPEYPEFVLNLTENQKKKLDSHFNDLNNDYLSGY